MCEKLPYCGVRIDTCMDHVIDKINITTEFKTLLCCCGHGKYPPTIVVLNPQTNEVFEYFSQKFLSQGIRSQKKYYKKDKQGYYYLPELQPYISSSALAKVS